MGNKYTVTWGALVCSNVWLSAGNTGAGVVFIAIAIAALLFAE